MMVINIGNTSDDERVIDKTVTLSPVNCEPYNEVDILNPTFLLEYKANLTSCNYLHVPLWNRYYYITDINVMPGNKMTVSCHVDVLKTYAPQIRETEAYIDRSGEGSDTGKFLPDAGIPIDTKSVIKNIRFANNPFGRGHYVLTVLGGGNRGD